MEQSDRPEVEWQFDAVDLRPVERWLRRLEDPAVKVSGGRTRILVDRYLDTPDWRLYRAGFALRIRRAEGRNEATLKSLDPGKAGLRARREITQFLASPEPEALLGSAGPVSERLEAVGGPGSIRRVVEIRSRRTTFLIDWKGSEAEMALDQTTIPVGEKEPPARLRRVEVEVRTGAPDDLAPFVESLREACGLAPATLSKFEAGLLAIGAEPAPGPQPEQASVEPGSSVGEAAFAILGRHFATFLEKEPGTRLGEDPEDLHDMRVATRRLRAAMSLFRGALPVRAVGLRAELKWVAGLLGAVRDLDVQIEQTLDWNEERSEAEPGAHDALAALRSLLEAERAQARRGLLEGLDSARYHRLIRGFRAMLEHGPLRRSPASREPIAEFAPGTLRPRYRKIRRSARKLGPDPEPPMLHRLRIRCKRLRYALEFLSPLYGEPAQSTIRRLVKVQDLIGAHQDAQVAMARLRGMVEKRGSELPPASVFLMGEIVERYAQEAARLRRKFPKVYARLRRPWKSLDKGMGSPAPPAERHAAPVPRPVPALVAAIH
jgi:triphosphatase